jgi:hypothetical protein
LGSNFWITGAPASSGRVGWTWSTRCLTSMAAWSTETSNSNWAITSEKPSPEIDDTSVMPASVATASSSGSLTWLAVSAEPAPG